MGTASPSDSTLRKRRGLRPSLRRIPRNVSCCGEEAARRGAHIRDGVVSSPCGRIFTARERSHHASGSRLLVHMFVMCYADDASAI